MIARAQLPARFVAWNGRTGAPYSGPYAHYQFGRSTRIWEYPWAFHAAPLSAGMRALDVGGALSGFSISLSQAGLQVTVVDPDPVRSPPPLLEQWARQWGATVRAVCGRAETLEEPGGSFDVAFCLSVIEHIPTLAERGALLRGVHRLLRPGGIFVVTLDLALDLAPFSAQERRADLQNVSVLELLEAADFSLESGLLPELCGMPRFDPAAILERVRRGDFLFAEGALTSQCFTLRRNP